MNAYEITFALLMGFSLAATCGLRAFLPLFIIALGAKAGLIQLGDGFDWMMSYPALICFGSATVLEILGDKIPAVDHVLDSAGAFVRPVAGALAASSLIKGVDPLVAVVIGIIMGGGIAGIVQTIKGALRLLSTAITGGIANPVVSAAEDGATAVTAFLGLIVPYVTAALILIGLFAGGRFFLRRLKPKKEKQDLLNNASTN
jgi:hypothetical protein